MIRDNISFVRNRIARLSKRIDKSPDLIKIVVATKGRSVEEIQEVVAAGITDIGENRVQEAVWKYEQIFGSQRAPSTEHREPIRWHMLGHLQANKVRDAVRMFDLIHSVDSLRIASEIDRQALKINKIQGILVEVKTSSEVEKFGVKPEDTANFVKEVIKFRNLNLKGLMTMAPVCDDSEKARPYFRMLRELRDRIVTHPAACAPLPILSMGMSGDFEVAIEEGANIVRLGRVIFDSEEKWRRQK